MAEYVFRLTVTDDRGGVDTVDLTVPVSSEPLATGLKVNVGGVLKAVTIKTNVGGALKATTLRAKQNGVLK